MLAKKLMVLLVVSILTLGTAGIGFSAQQINGSIIDIKANTLTIMDETGKEVKVDVKNIETIKDIKVGDIVEVKDGEVQKKESS
ncbi:MAG: hypothetical protein KKC46_21590 [Proteobacteria bacterium]|nr:hypothetical protein [Pseudomonadota bacterium]